MSGRRRPVVPRTLRRTSALRDCPARSLCSARPFSPVTASGLSLPPQLLCAWASSQHPRSSSRKTRSRSPRRAAADVHHGGVELGDGRQQASLSRRDHLGHDGPHWRGVRVAAAAEREFRDAVKFPHDRSKWSESQSFTDTNRGSHADDSERGSDPQPRHRRRATNGKNGWAKAIGTFPNGMGVSRGTGGRECRPVRFWAREPHGRLSPLPRRYQQHRGSDFPRRAAGTRCPQFVAPYHPGCESVTVDVRGGGGRWR